MFKYGISKMLKNHFREVERTGTRTSTSICTGSLLKRIPRLKKGFSVRFSVVEILLTCTYHDGKLGNAIEFSFIFGW